MEDLDSDDMPILSKEEAVLEVRHWLEVERIDPQRIFTQVGEETVRYKDLIPHLEGETPDGRLLLFAISRARLMRASRNRRMHGLLPIDDPPGTPEKSSPS